MSRSKPKCCLAATGIDFYSRSVLLRLVRRRDRGTPFAPTHTDCRCRDALGTAWAKAPTGTAGRRTGTRSHHREIVMGQGQPGVQPGEQHGRPVAVGIGDEPAMALSRTIRLADSAAVIPCALRHVLFSPHARGDGGRLVRGRGAGMTRPEGQGSVIGYSRKSPAANVCNPASLIWKSAAPSPFTSPSTKVLPLTVS